MKKRTLKKICDYWESEAGRSDAEAAVWRARYEEAAAWRARYEEAARQLEMLRRDPLSSFAAEFRSEALRQIDAWPQGPREGAGAEGQIAAPVDDTGGGAPAEEPTTTG